MITQNFLINPPVPLRNSETGHYKSSYIFNRYFIFKPKRTNFGRIFYIFEIS